MNDCLVSFLESSSLIMEAQSGFRKTQSTMGGFLDGEHVVSFSKWKKHMTPHGNMEL